MRSEYKSYLCTQSLQVYYLFLGVASQPLHFPCYSVFQVLQIVMGQLTHITDSKKSFFFGDHVNQNVILFWKLGRVVSHLQMIAWFLLYLPHVPQRSSLVRGSCIINSIYMSICNGEQVFLARMPTTLGILDNSCKSRQYSVILLAAKGHLKLGLTIWP